MLLLYIVYCTQTSYHIVNIDKEVTYARKLYCLTIVPQLLEALVELLKPIERLLTIEQQASCGTKMALCGSFLKTPQLVCLGNLSHTGFKEKRILYIPPKQAQRCVSVRTMCVVKRWLMS